MFERKVEQIDDAYIDVYLHNQSASKSLVYARIASDGLGECSVQGLASVNEGFSASGDKGIVAELAIPLSSLDLSVGDEVMLNVILRAKGLSDGFSNADKNKPSTWMKIRLR